LRLSCCPCSTGLHLLKSPQLHTEYDKLIITDASFAIDTKGFLVAPHHVGDVSSLQLNVANLVERSSAGWVILSKMGLLDSQRFLKVLNGKIQAVDLILYRKRWLVKSKFVSDHVGRKEARYATTQMRRRSGPC